MAPKKRVCLIHTGGTIGMKPTPYGYAPAPGYMAEALAGLPELSDPAMPQYDLVEYQPLLDSSYMAAPQWNRIARDIRDRYQDYDGFVVLHGTDTMAYTASALSFMLEGLAKPVILTGSQIPFCRIRSDARDNLICAMLLAAGEPEPVPEVCLWFGGKLLRGTRATKVSADHLIAFDSPNCPHLARDGVRITIYREQLRPPGKALKLQEFGSPRIAVLKVFPGIQFDLFEKIMTPDLRGLVLEAFGAGNIPANEGGLARLLDRARENGTILVVCTQCLKGSAAIGQYETSRPLREMGAVCGWDMTAEAAVAKLYYLLSQDLPTAQVKSLMEQNLRGELSGP